METLAFGIRSDRIRPEWVIGVAGKAQHLGVLLGQRLVEVLGVGPGDAPALPVEAGGVLGSSPVVWVRMVR